LEAGKPHFSQRGMGFIVLFDQEILGHKSGKTTEIYTHVSTKNIGKIKSPLDNLNLKRGGDV
jgi:site-specific recombinase XerD